MLIEKVKKREAICQIRNGGRGIIDSLSDLLLLELQEAYSEMEDAATTNEIWRAQGKAQQCRSLLNLLKKES